MELRQAYLWKCQWRWFKSWTLIHLENQVISSCFYSWKLVHSKRKTWWKLGWQLSSSETRNGKREYDQQYISTEDLALNGFLVFREPMKTITLAYIYTPFFQGSIPCLFVFLISKHFIFVLANTYLHLWGCNFFTEIAIYSKRMFCTSTGVPVTLFSAYIYFQLQLDINSMAIFAGLILI